MSCGGAGIPRICFVVASPMTARAFLTEHIRRLRERYEIHLFANANPESLRDLDLPPAAIHRVRIERTISPLADLKALARLVSLFKRHGYAAVHSITPKAGLLTALAGFVARVPVRVHTYTGQVWVTRRGLARHLLKALDRLTARLDTHLLADSASQLQFLRDEGVLTAQGGEVLEPGSVQGVDVTRFRADSAARSSVRAELRVPADATLFLFVGRLARDKGVLDLAEAFARVAREAQAVHLLLVGPDEERLTPRILSAAADAAARVHFVGMTKTPERYVAAADVFCLPSYREGFGSVVIEAAAAGIPAIGTRIYGVTDAIEDTVTGLLVAPGDVAELSAAMLRLARDRAARRALGEAARERAVSQFAQDKLTSALLAFYARVIPAAGPDAPSTGARL